MFLTIFLAVAQLIAPNDKPKSKDPIVHVRGCVHGTTLIVSEDPGFNVQGGKIILKGGRTVMNALKEHNGHQEEIVGVLKPAQKSGAALKEKRGKKTRVYVGVSETRSDSTDDVTAAPVLDVRELAHIAPRCQ